MGVDSCSSIDNLRVNWTSPMDHYFIEVLQDQVRRQNKTGNAFSKQAWEEMIELFNEKFGFRHDIDVLKNRYKRLRKQYNDIKILTRSGFSWDEKQQMIAADDHTWDDYIKAHPDMRIYRRIAVPYYKELCIICGHSVADGRYSLSSLDVDYDEEAKTLDDQTPAKDDRIKVEWSETMDKHFIQLMLNQVHKGNKIGRTFKKKAWIHMTTEFNTEFGCQYGKVILKNRYNILRRQCCTVKCLLRQRGFSWDESQQMLIADNPVWNNVIKERRNLRRYRNKPMPYFIEMRTICGNETSWIKDNMENGNPMKNTGGVSIPIVKAKIKNEACKETSDWIGEKNLSNQKKRRQLDTEPKFEQSKKMQRVDRGMADALREMVVAVTTLTKKKKENESSVSTKNVIDAVQAIPDIDEDLLFDACDFLEDERKARMFLALDCSLRKKWLLRKLRP